MMHDLEMPLAHAGLQVDADQALAIEIVARTLAAIVIRSGRFHRQIHQARLRIGRDLRPHASVAVVIGRAVLPSVIAKLALPWNGVEGPAQFAGSNVEGA